MLKIGDFHWFLFMFMIFMLYYVVLTLLMSPLKAILICYCFSLTMPFLPAEITCLILHITYFPPVFNILIIIMLFSPNDSSELHLRWVPLTLLPIEIKKWLLYKAEIRKQYILTCWVSNWMYRRVIRTGISYDESSLC